MTRIPYAYSQRPPRIIRTAAPPVQPVEVIESAPVTELAPVVEETPVEETPVEETPVEEALVEETPVEETPVVEESLPEWNALMKKADLYEIAEKAGLSVNPEMTKAEIVDLLKTVQ